jgi:hypothetical protein
LQEVHEIYITIYNETRHPVYMMDVSFVLVEGEEERPTDQVIATMANLIRADAFQLEFASFRAKFLTLQAGQLITTSFSPQLKMGGGGGEVQDEYRGYEKAKKCV